MALYLLFACLIVAFLDWLAVFKGWRPVEYVAKPAVMILLLAWLLSNARLAGAPFWFSAGIVFSLVGDVLLLLPQVRFLPGLLAFLLAHLAYITGYNQVLPSFNLPVVVLALVVAFIAWRLYLRLAESIRQKNPHLAAPVLVYAIVITLMLISALLNFFKTEWLPLAALLSGSGALFFFVSDNLLASNRFVSPSRYGRLPEMVAYHLGQMLIISGVILQYH
jgi:alkenylglycerophosphocholine/alkenylglycerophosphoethanolamine hydrolase